MSCFHQHTVIAMYCLERYEKLLENFAYPSNNRAFYELESLKPCICEKSRIQCLVLNFLDLNHYLHTSTHWASLNHVSKRLDHHSFLTVFIAIFCISLITTITYLVNDSLKENPQEQVNRSEFIKLKRWLFLTIGYTTKLCFISSLRFII